MQVDHIIPDGNDSLENLALSCWNCNNAKRQATFVYDDETQQSVPLFHPRQQHWRDHFEWSPDTTILIAKTAIGRVTIKRFRMNRPLLVIARQRWVRLGFHPPAS